MARKTALQAYQRAAALIRTEASGSGIPGLDDDRTLDWINDLCEEYFERLREMSGRLPSHMLKAKGYNALGTTSLAENITTASTDFDVGDGDQLYANSANAAAIYSQGTFDVFTYTGNASDNISGVANIDFNHSNGDAVHALHPLPSTFGDFRVTKKHNGITLNGFGGYQRVPEWPQGMEFALYYDSDENPYLWLPRAVTTGVITVFYWKKPDVITDLSATLEMDSPDHMYVVHGLVGIFKQVLDDGYVPNLEEQRKVQVLQDAMRRGTVGRPISASDAYFQRTYDAPDVGFYLPTDE